MRRYFRFFKVKEIDRNNKSSPSTSSSISKTVPRIQHNNDNNNPYMHELFGGRVSRGDFLKLLTIGFFTGSMMMLRWGGGSLSYAQGSSVTANNNNTTTSNSPSIDSRQDRGIKIRHEMAQADYLRAAHPNNGEEDHYLDAMGNRTFIASFSKSLPHYPADHPKAGEVMASAYITLLNAINSEEGNPGNFEDVPGGGPRRLVNPVAGKAFDVVGLDSNSTSIPPPPRIDSAEAAGEMAELYHMAICRDIPFNEFNTNSSIAEAARDLSMNYQEFPASPYPPAGFALNVGTIFRGFTLGDVTGPYVSQFLLKGSNDIGGIDENDGQIKYGSLSISQQQYTLTPQLDYMTNYSEWLDIQNGRNVQTRLNLSCGNSYDTSRRRFIRNMRDLGSYVHYDELSQPYTNACLILLHMDAPSCVDTRPTYSQYNPYTISYDERQVGLVTFGSSQILGLVMQVASAALKAAWFQKWFVHRRLRPEAFSGLIHRQLSLSSPPPANPRYPIHSDILESEVLPIIFKRNRDLHFRRFGLSDAGSYLLPQVYPEGSPVHPSYPAGHATVAGACVTVLKAFFDEAYRIPNPVQPNNDGTDLVPATNYDGSSLSRPLTVGNELDKLASNISLGRNMAGIHYRSDYTQSLLLGESVAISILQDLSATFNEKFSLRFTRFDRSTVTIEN
jgi:hypothetical protein